MSVKRGRGQKSQISDSEYELLRKKNIDDNKAMLAKLLEDLKDVAPLKLAPRRSSQKLSSRRESDSFVMRNTRRSTRLNPMGSESGGPLTRARSRRGSLSSMSTSSSASTSPNRECGGRLRVKFGSFFKSRNREDAEDEDSDSWDYDDEEEDMELKLKKKRRSRPSSLCYERDLRKPEEIGDDELEAVAQHVADKSYDAVYGSTCHQCRQKTIDMKTICRGEECWGTRGQFCGPCLRNRYGEDAQVALKDPEWKCPPCRGICNCSICRRRQNKSATGILIHLAREAGYKDCNAYLQSLKKKK